MSIAESPVDKLPESAPVPPAPRTIVAENAGPCERVVIPVPADGGVVLLQGRNGRGKSKTLQAIDSIITGKQPPGVKRGAARGKISGLGITINLSQRTTRKGSLEVESMADKFGVSQLIDPGVKDPEAADARRIKALLNIAGGEVTPEEWRAVCGESWTDDMTDLIDEDPVETAARLAKHLQGVARDLEKSADDLETRAKVLRESAGEHKVEITEEEANKRLEEAIRTDSRLKATAKAGEDAKKRQEQACEQLAAMRKAMNESGGTVESLRAEYAVASKLLSDTDARITALESELTKAKAERGKLLDDVAEKNKRIGEATQRDSLMSKLQTAIDANIVTVATEALEQAAGEVEAAKRLSAQCVLAKDAERKLGDAKQATEDAADKRKRAVAARAAADKTDDALSAAVGKLGCPLRVSGCRLKAKNSQGDEVNFAELSDGEAAKVAVDIVADAAGEGNVFVLDQDIWEGLDPIAQVDVWRRTKERRVVMYAAEATADEGVTAIEFDPVVAKSVDVARTIEPKDVSEAVENANRQLMAVVVEGF